jgi:glycosyltransferase involved in cell wall biosynthesis
VKAEVILWTDAREWDLTLERFCTVKHFDPDTVLPRDFTAARRGTGPEMLFVHIGNSWVYHAGLMRLAQRIPSIVVLHDLAIQELMLEAVAYDEWDASAYLAGMEKWYGAEGVKVGQACLDKTEKGSAISSQMPGFELVLEKARAVLTHTDVACDAVWARLPHLPCFLLPLPFVVGLQPTFERAVDGPLRLLQFGWIGPNRRLEQVLETLAQMPADFSYRLDVMGKIWNPDVIHTKVADLGLGAQVHLHGYVPEVVLEDALRQAHLVLNLRHPSMGEASGSQLRIWNAGATAAVTREGWYAGLPEDVAYLIDLEDETAQLHRLFSKLAADRSLGQTVGSAGRAYFETHHAPETYVQEVIKLAEETSLNARRTLALRSHTRFKSDSSVTAMQQESMNRLDESKPVVR